MKLSIITVNLNNVEGLRKTIDSVVSQTWQEFEWIIVDGGSTDGSKELIEETAKTCPNITYWCCEPDKGIYNAMNKGIGIARGEFLNFMNSGDLFFDSNVLHVISQKLKKSDIYYGDSYKYLNGSSFFIKAPKRIDIPTLLRRNVCHQAMFIRSILLKEDLFDETFRIYADWQKWLKLSYAGKEFTYLEKPICSCMDGGLSTNKKIIDSELDRIKTVLPPNILNLAESYLYIKDKLQQYEECELTRDTLSLIYERPFFCKLIHLNILFVKILKKIYR